MPSWDGDLTASLGRGDDDAPDAPGGSKKKAKITEANIEAAVDDTFA